MGVKVGHLPDPYRIDIAYADGQPVGTVEKVVMDEPNPDPLGPYIRQALREEFSVGLRAVEDSQSQEAGCLMCYPG